MKKSYLLFLILFNYYFGYGQTNSWNDSLKTNWFKENTIMVSSVSSFDTNYFDLQPLKNVLKNVKIIMLGEAAHGEGNVTSAKIRLIKYLHEEMGFDMLAFESGFYDFHKASESVKNGMRIDTALNYSILGVWTGMNEFDPLLKYINDSNVKGNNPLSFCGIDNQMTENYWSSSSLMKDIEKEFKEISPLSEVDRKLFYALIDKARSYQNNPFGNLQDSSRFFLDLNMYVSLTKKLKDKEKGCYWKQIFKCIEAESKSAMAYRNNAEKPWYLIAGIRDEQMADNLIWLIEHNPDKKFIVWAASNHLSRNLNTLKEVNDTAFYAHYKPMGEYIKNKYGDKAYSMGFISAGGTWYAKGMMPKPKEVKPAINNSVEYYMQQANIKYGIVNYKNLSQGNFLNKEIFSNPFGHSQILGIWPNVLDGVFFIKEIIPPTFKN